MLEEIGYKYNVTKIDIDKGEQFNEGFKKISPFSKIPAIIDHKNNKSIFESGAILIYLADQSGKFFDKKTINVDTEKFETNQKGIYAVGDICTYPGKLKLILSGFHEGALAARACFKLARPNEKYKFEFTTSSKSIKDRLGIKE